MEYSEKLNGLLGNAEVRGWYKTHIVNIPSLFTGKASLLEQAKDAASMRNLYRNQARAMMSEIEKVKELNSLKPNLTFEELLEHKRKKYGLSGDEAHKDIIRSSSTSNKDVDADLGFIK